MARKDRTKVPPPLQGVRWSTRLPTERVTRTVTREWQRHGTTVLTKWMGFVLTGTTGTTLLYEVRALDLTRLGQIKWFGRWRCYAFFPGPDTVFNDGCLDDIAAFCSQLTHEHRVTRGARPATATKTSGRLATFEDLSPEWTRTR